MKPDHTHPANTVVLAELKRHAFPARLSDEPFVLDGYTLSTHPDLEERLFELAAALPMDCRSSAFGKPVLTAPNGVIFAVAGGMFELALRIPDDQHETARALAVQPETMYGPEWWRFTAFSPSFQGRESFMTALRSWCVRAFEDAVGLQST
jgi:hypothetical protein